MSVKASDVKKLREQTGAGLMDCKKALTDSNGDFDKAVKILKELGLAAAAKRSDRETNEGRVFTLVNENKAIIIEIGCETDFVARNNEFKAFGEKVLEYIAETGTREVDSNIRDMATEAISVIKENITVTKIKLIEVSPNTIIADYIHGEGQTGVLVKVEVEDSTKKNNEKLKEFANDCALHIAAFNPLYLDKTAVDKSYVTEQEEIFAKQAENMDKPEKVIQGIIKGKLSKHLGEICFLQQDFVKDDKVSVEKVAENLGKELGTKIAITDFACYQIGDN